MPHTELQIETADGRCPTHAYHPSGSGPWPGVIMYIDGIGMRPVLDHTIETYQALHGFVPRDTPVHDEAATAKHWETLLALFADTLKRVATQ